MKRVLTAASSWRCTMKHVRRLSSVDDQVRAFAGMLTNLTGHDLPNWIDAARDAGLPGIASFAKGLEHDLDAVTNGRTMPWSSGPVEGRVNF